MPELGDKHTCADCETKYYDLGRADATCPKCGSANRVDDDEVAVAAPRAPRKKSPPKPVPPVDNGADEDDGKDEGGEDNEELDLGDEVVEEEEAGDEEE